ncbi:MAG TPA: hypothetical protein VK184_10380 [Nostocaceae cyanobacterium]|nr:hypothetical protein [Nostocaceae cyanobacterium]
MIYFWQLKSDFPGRLKLCKSINDWVASKNYLLNLLLINHACKVFIILKNNTYANIVIFQVNICNTDRIQLNADINILPVGDRETPAL